ncbi:HAD-IC family P-type ATPase [Limosilactobacillus fermentum]|uniref:HAD-IC family P-type ATPase n=3 Tax=Limosilactobacillus fermentum TaxID=1613 RepID=UPI001C9DF5D8|nr:HAD-IC family P-type ATPase [Limosilactobacillus fermentum]MDC6078944.1 HAD-IC family P-type ATPase [Limosilactobacillus fermentum]
MLRQRLADALDDAKNYGMKTGLMLTRNDNNATVMLTSWEEPQQFERWENGPGYEPLLKYSAPGPDNIYFHDNFIMDEDYKEGVTMADEVKTSGVDLEKAPLDQVMQELGADAKTGLSSSEAQARLQKYGANALEEKEESFTHKLVHAFMGPIEYMIEAAAIISAIIGHWDDFIIIMLLLIFNVTIDLWQSQKASSALVALKKGMAPQANTLRDGKYQTIDAATLVPGDIIKIRLGMIVPADLRLISGDYASIDQSALTGESIVANKKVGDEAHSGSVVKQGEMEAVVIATGSNTFFGRTAKLVANAGAKSHAQQAMFQIGNYLIVIAVILAVIMVAFDVFNDLATHSMNTSAALGILQFVLVLLVASIPVAMPTVFSITLALGALSLSKKKAIVSQLASIEEMAGIDILCSDKIGTLTKNQLTLGETTLLHAKDEQEVVFAGTRASKIEDNDAIDTDVINALKDKDSLKSWTVDKFIPFDPVTKRTEADAHDQNGNQVFFSKGAPQVIVDLAKPGEAEAKQVNDLITNLANKGYRALGVAKSTDQGKSWQILGVFSMFDPPRDDSKATIDAAKAKGVNVKMITGDDTAIAIETCRQLGLGTNILNAADVFPKDMDPDNVPDDIAETIEKAD